ncbi:MAG TPA: nitrogenase iron-molybdenum cofactor biosynthesis protein NifN [Nitrospirae bacterium]|nr:nitrogenase iron-molybdenum cofactor biosynthesis protein NifN [Nitrospirota bacterium]
MKEGFPFVDVNQERHTPYAGYEGLVNLAEDISKSIRFFSQESKVRRGPQKIGDFPGQRCQELKIKEPGGGPEKSRIFQGRDAVINPLKHSQSIGAVMALQGIDRALPVIHGAQGCAFLAKVLVTKHFREPVALASTKLFTEDVVMGSEERLSSVIEGIVEKQRPGLIAILTSGLSEVRGDDVAGSIKDLRCRIMDAPCSIVHVSTPDYDGGIEDGYAKTVEALLDTIVPGQREQNRKVTGQVNLLVGSHLTPADFTELREIVEAFGLRPIILPDLAALDGSRQGFSSLASGGTGLSEISLMGLSEYTIAIGVSMESPARKLRERFGIEYTILEGISGLRGTDTLMDTLSALSGRALPARYERQRRVLIDAMRDAHFYYGGKRFCTALEPDLSVQFSRVVEEMGAVVELAVVPNHSASLQRISAKEVRVGDLFSIDGGFDLLISNSHGEITAERLGIPLYEMGFPVYRTIGYPAKSTIGYRGTLQLIMEMANLLMEVH